MVRPNSTIKPNIAANNFDRNGSIKMWNSHFRERVNIARSTEAVSVCYLPEHHRCLLTVLCRLTRYNDKLEVTENKIKELSKRNTICNNYFVKIEFGGKNTRTSSWHENNPSTNMSKTAIVFSGNIAEMLSKHRRNPSKVEELRWWCCNSRDFRTKCPPIGGADETPRH